MNNDLVLKFIYKLYSIFSLKTLNCIKLLSIITHTQPLTQTYRKRGPVTRRKIKVCVENLIKMVEVWITLNSNRVGHILNNNRVGHILNNNRLGHIL